MATRKEKLHKGPVVRISQLPPVTSIFQLDDNIPVDQKSSLIIGLCRPTVSVASSASGVRSYIEFSQFGSKAASCVLEQCLDQLCIVGRMDLRSIGESTVINELKKSMLERYSERERHMLYNIDTLEPSDLPTNVLRSRKFREDFVFLYKLINCIRNDIKIARMCDTLQECVYYYKRRNGEERNTIERQTLSNWKLQKLYYDLKRNEEIASNKSRDLDYEIRVAELRIHDEIVIDETRKRLVDNFENARGEQMRKILEDKEKDLKRLIEELKRKTEWENRIHEDLVRYLKSATVGLQQQVIEWNDKYDADYNRLDDLIIGSRSKKEEQEERLGRMRAMYDYRDREIQEYLFDKRSKEFVTRKIAAVNSIQAWWRGCAFRKGIKIRSAKKNKGSKKRTKSKKGKK